MCSAENAGILSLSGPPSASASATPLVRSRVTWNLAGPVRYMQHSYAAALFSSTASQSLHSFPWCPQPRMSHTVVVLVSWFPYPMAGYPGPPRQ